jgi:RNA polymerase sigma-70 factor (ECF subfamily)
LITKLEKKNSDFELIDKINAGDKLAFKILFDKYYSQMTKTAYLFVKDSDTAEEIVQEFFIKLWIKKNEININSSVKSYLFQSIRFRSINYNRDHKRIASENFELELINDSIENQFEDFDYDIIKNKLVAGIDSLPEKCKIIFLLSREESLTYKQIAEKLDISQKTVENQIGIALKKLREKLQPLLKNLIYSLIFLIKDFFQNY